VIPAVVRRLPVSHNKVSFDYKAKRFINGAMLAPADAHYWWKVIFNEEAKATLYANGTNGHEDSLRFYREIYGCTADPVTDSSTSISKIYLPTIFS
jgi:asparagine synthase (glutamine-hydrolysing)